MKKRQRVRTEKRVLADGSVKLYHYAAKTAKITDTKTVAKMLAAWQISPKWRGLAKSTKTSYTLYSQPFYDSYKQVPIASIKRRHILGLRDIIAADRGHGAALGFCGTIYGFFGWLVENDHLDASPANKLEKDLIHGTLPTWTMAQALKAEAELPQHYARAVFLARHIGQRRGDLCALRWSQYDGQTIKLVQQKTKVALTIPLTPEARTALDAWKKDAKGLTILTTATGAPFSPGSLSGHLPEMLESIGLPPLGIHGLRKLMAVTLAQAGCSAHEIASMTGHKTLAMVQAYTKEADQVTMSRAAILRLDNLQKPTKRENS